MSNLSNVWFKVTDLQVATGRGCRVTTTTISKEQYEYAKQRVAELGLGDRITLLLKDYRALEGEYDKLVSIEMIEAVGHQYYDTFFRCCSERLKDDGMMLVQAITIADRYYEEALREVDFIKRFVFPGGFLPSVTEMAKALTRATDLRISHLEDIGLHYATTLAHWRRNFFRQLGAVREMGYPEAFIRMWDFYLCYCEGAFRERAISDVLMLWTGPQSRLRTL